MALDSVKYVNAGNQWAQSVKRPGRRGPQLGRAARAMGRAGARVRLLPRSRLLQVPGQQLRHPPRRLRGPGEEGGLPGVFSGMGDGARVRPSQPARRDRHRAQAVPRAGLDPQAAGRHQIDDGARQRVPAATSPSARAGAGTTSTSGACSSRPSRRSARSPRTSRRRTCSRTISSPRPTPSTTRASRPMPTATSCPRSSRRSTSRRFARGSERGAALLRAASPLRRAAFRDRRGVSLER